VDSTLVRTPVTSPVAQPMPSPIVSARRAVRLLTRPHQINSGLCDRLLSAFHIGGADLRIIRTADSVHAIAAHVAAGTGIGITVESALDHQPPGLRVIPSPALRPRPTRLSSPPPITEVISVRSRDLRGRHCAP
jgi:DNA-binding transcriptional LysR family regulator